MYATALSVLQTVNKLLSDYQGRSQLSKSRAPYCHRFATNLPQGWQSFANPVAQWIRRSVQTVILRPFYLSLQSPERRDQTSMKHIPDVFPPGWRKQFPTPIRKYVFSGKRDTRQKIFRLLRGSDPVSLSTLIPLYPQKTYTCFTVAKSLPSIRSPHRWREFPGSDG